MTFPLYVSMLYAAVPHVHGFFIVFTFFFLIIINFHSKIKNESDFLLPLMIHKNFSKKLIFNKFW